MVFHFLITGNNIINITIELFKCYHDIFPLLLYDITPKCVAMALSYIDFDIIVVVLTCW